MVDKDIVEEIVYLNNVCGLETEASCQGNKDTLPTALVKPSMVELATQLGYRCRMLDDVGLCEITLHSLITKK